MHGNNSERKSPRQRKTGRTHLDPTRGLYGAPGEIRTPDSLVRSFDIYERILYKSMQYTVPSGTTFIVAHRRAQENHAKSTQRIQGLLSPSKMASILARNDRSTVSTVSHTILSLTVKSPWINRFLIPAISPQGTDLHFSLSSGFHLETASPIISRFRITPS